MDLSVELHGQLTPRSPRRQMLNLPESATARQAAVQLGLDLEEVGLVVINGIQSELDDVLSPGCRLSFFPYISGG